MPRFFPHITFRRADQSLFALPAEQFQRLLQDGQLSIPLPGETAVDDWCLAYDAARTELQFYDQTEDLDVLLDHARLMRPLPAR